MQKSFGAFSAIYLFFLIALVMCFGAVVINKQNFFQSQLQFSKVEDILSQNIITRGNISLNYDTQNNSGSGTYKPFLTCPDTVNYFSGTQILFTGSVLYQSGNCMGTLSGKTLYVYFNASQTGFTNGSYSGIAFSLTGTSYLSGQLSGTAAINFQTPTLFDTRFINARLEMNGMVFKNTLYNNIFWNNTDIMNYIDKNTNNIGVFPKIDTVASGVIYLNVDGSMSGKIIEFDRNIYNTNSKLLKKSVFLFSNTSSSGSGYIQQDGTISSSTGSAKILDFKDKDYAIFLSYSSGSSENMRYKLKVLDMSSNQFAYINPIKDDTGSLEYQGFDVLIDGGLYYFKLYKIN